MKGKAIKASPVEKPRQVKTWRIRQDIIKRIKKLALEENKAECELIERAIELY